MKNKKLYLLRHAKSSWKFPDLSDFERPLNKRGQRDAPLMGSILKGLNIFPDLILSSPAKRAITTANLVAQGIHFPLDEIKSRMDLYHASTESVLKMILNFKDKHKKIMLVGHNEWLTNLANILNPKQIDNIVTCGIVSLEFEVKSWKEIKISSGKLLFYEYPKKYY